MTAAIAILVLGAFVAVAVVISALGSRDSARDRLDNATATRLAKDSASMLAANYSAMSSGEHHGFAPRQAQLQEYADRVGGTLVANSTLPQQLQAVDTSSVPVDSQFAIQVPVDDGTIGYWQIVSVSVPEWGVTPGARVTVYVRSWIAAPDGTPTQPSITRVELRPTWFADFQFLVDGPVSFGNGAVINGPVHSNGYRVSFFDSYAGQAEMIAFSAGASCAPTARVTTASGSIGPCAGEVEEGIGVRHNLLRAKSAIDAIGRECVAPTATSLAIRCYTPGNPLATSTVTLSGSTVSYPGGSLNAAVGGRNAINNQGAVLVVYGNVRLTGNLGANARATIVAASRPGSTVQSDGSAPSIWIQDSGWTGSATSATSSVGIIAEGDVIADQTAACSVRVRGAVMSMTGMVSMHPTWRVPFTVPGAPAPCGRFTIEGSIVGHYPPMMIAGHNNAGFSQRSYVYRPQLYNNPPPLFPTADDWEVTRLSPADLDCFESTSGEPRLDMTKEGCT